MTQDEIIALAKQVGVEATGNEYWPFFIEELVELVKRVEEKAAAKEREACVKSCKKLFKVFLSSKYSTGQPLSSFKERHAVAACIESIEARGQA